MANHRLILWFPLRKHGPLSSSRKWGDTLLTAGGKTRPSWDRKGDLVLSHIGYWTDRGGCEC